MEEEISFADFREHRSQIEAERARLRNMVDAIRQHQHLVKADSEIALQLATEFGFLFGRAILTRSGCFMKPYSNVSM